ncbi:MAG: hypothetical protein AAFV88_01290, partial [Planctomycetota bacterium]
RLQSVFEPVARMKRTLFLEGVWAVFSFFVVSATLWFLVRRIGRDPAPQPTRRPLAGSDSAPEPPSPSPAASQRTGTTETLAAPTNPVTPVEKSHR